MEETVAVGYHSVTRLANPGNISKLKEMFPEAPKGVFTHMHGNIALLIGLDNSRLHPKGGRDVGKFRLV